MTHSFSLSKYVHETVLDGMTVVSVVTRDPIATVVGSFPAGRMYDMSHGGAVALLASRMLGESAIRHSKQELHEILEGMGASVSFDIDDARGRFVASGLASDMPVILDTVGEMIREPRFDAEEFSVMKTRLIAEILAESDEPKARARILLSQTLYPKGHPHYIVAPVDVAAMLDATTVDEVRTFHTATYGRGDMIAVASGAVKHDVFVATCETAFGNLPEILPVVPEILGAAGNTTRHMVHDHMQKKETAAVYVGNTLDLVPLDPAYDAFAFGLAVLGGGMFANRLNQEIREKRGLTYLVRSSIVGYHGRLSGYWLSLAMFPERVYAEGVGLLIDEIESISLRGITARELAEKKEESLGRFLTQFDNRHGMASFVASAYEQGIPVSHIDTYPERIVDMTVARVNDALAGHLHATSMVVASAGDISENVRANADDGHRSHATKKARVSRRKR